MGGDGAKSVKKTDLLMVMRVEIGRGVCNVIWGAKLSCFLVILYISMEVLLFESKIRCQKSTLLVIFLIINKYIAAHLLPLPLIYS